MSIGGRIREIRKLQGLSIDELACKLGKNRTTIYRYENGEIENLPLGILDSLASALNTTPAHLLGWDDANGNGNSVDQITESVGLKIKRFAMWREALDGRALTDDENLKLIEYAKFLLSTREK